MIFIPHQVVRQRVMLAGQDITKECFWADDVTCEACVFINTDDAKTARRYGHIVISSDTCPLHDDWLTAAPHGWPVSRSHCPRCGATWTAKALEDARHRRYLERTRRGA